MSKCNTCVYRFRDEHRTACGYILSTGAPRGCTVEECDKYKRGRSYAKKAALAAVSIRGRRVK